LRLKRDSQAVDNPTVMSAGDSAREQAKQLSEVSDVHERKAQWALRRSANFAAGAAGEEAIAEAFAPLTAKGWFPLYDRASPSGGNIDLLAVGPAGVAVIDAKAWTGTVTIDGTKLLLNGHSRAKDLNGVHRQVAEVEAAMHDAELVVTVRGFLALAGEQDRNRPSETVDSIKVLGMDQLVEKFSRFEQRLTTVEVETALRDISLAFPPAGRRDQGKTSTGAVDPVEPTNPRTEALIAGQLRFYYLRPWRNRLYLKDDHGTDLGWKNTISGEVTMTCAGDNAKLGQAILKAATQTGVPLAAGDLPRVPVTLLGGQLLGRVARRYVAVLLGQEWRRRKRLYGRLIDPIEGHFELGHVDLATGDVHPAIEGNLNKNLGTGKGYLEWLAARDPARPGVKKSSAS
jgi:roadblock/LC7 domain-containing protein